ncbi:MAG: hypothetical protein ACLTEZ_09725 [Ruthenibacterium lactatiformans]|uniref:hypothetical protein n=1 Tax=Ruthenibacterium lactatiformans TaxID=1550024 RepID=UPI0039FA89F9
MQKTKTSGGFLWTKGIAYIGRNYCQKLKTGINYGNSGRKQLNVQDSGNAYAVKARAGRQRYKRKKTITLTRLHNGRKPSLF